MYTRAANRLCYLGAISNITPALMMSFESPMSRIAALLNNKTKLGRQDLF
jgi:hypothetical protein